jgi:integrase
MKREEGRGARTIQLIHVTLHNMLKQAVREGILSRNPADVVERPKVEQREMQILISDQIQRFLDAASGSRFETFYFLALSTGMREGELLGLKWSDINWKESKLFVQRELQLINGQGLIFLPPKTKAGVRMIQIGASTLRKLDEHRGQQEIQKSIAGERWQENDLLFTTKIGKPVDCNQVIKEFKHILKVAGLPNIRVHDLRHTSLSSLMNMGTPVNTVQRRAGHADPSTTVKVYGHATSQTQKKAAQKIESLIVSTIAKLR